MSGSVKMYELAYKPVGNDNTENFILGTSIGGSMQPYLYNNMDLGLDIKMSPQSFEVVSGDISLKTAEDYEYTYSPSILLTKTLENLDDGYIQLKNSKVQIKSENAPYIASLQLGDTRKTYLSLYCGDWSHGEGLAIAELQAKYYNSKYGYFSGSPLFINNSGGEVRIGLSHSQSEDLGGDFHDGKLKIRHTGIYENVGMSEATWLAIPHCIAISWTSGSDTVEVRGFYWKAMPIESVTYETIADLCYTASSVWINGSFKGFATGCTSSYLSYTTVGGSSTSKALSSNLTITYAQ